MADQELTALRIRIEAEIRNATKQLDQLAAKVVQVEQQVTQSVGRINNSLKSISKETVSVKFQIQNSEQINNLRKQVEDLQAKLNKPLTQTVTTRRSDTSGAAIPNQTEIDAFVTSVRSGVNASVEELKKFRSALAGIFEQRKLKLGVDDVEVVKLKKDLEFLNGFIADAKRDIKVRVKIDGDAEIKQRLNNLQKDYVLQIIPSFEDATFQKLLTEIQNKRINLTFEDVSSSIREEISRIEALKADLPVGADTSVFDSKVATLNSKLAKSITLQVDANTKPAEVDIARLENKVESVISKGPKLKIETAIITPDAELNKLYNLKRRLEAQIIRQKGTFDTREIEAAFNLVQSRIRELNSQGVRIDANNTIISTASLANVQKGVQLAKEFKATLEKPVTTNVNVTGLREVGRQANQVGRSFEQIVRDAPSFAYGTQQGLIAISNNIGPLQDSFARLAASAKENGVSIGTALKQALTGWNAVGLAISLAVTGVVLFGKELFGANEQAKKLKDRFKEIKDIVEGTKYSVPEAIGSTAGNKVEARAAAAIVADANKPLDERQKQLNRLKQLDKELFAGITLQQKGYENLTIAIDKYVEKQDKISSQKARFQDLSKLTAERNKLQTDLDEINAALELENRQFEKNSTFVDKATGRRITVTENASKTYLDLTKKAKDAEVQIQSLNDRISVITGEAITFQFGSVDSTELENATGSVKDILLDLLRSEKEALEARQKNVSNISKEYFDLAVKIADIDNKIKNVGVSDERIKSNNAETFRQVLIGIDIAAKDAGIELGALKNTLSDPSFFKGPNIEPFIKIREEAIKTQQTIDELFRSGELTIEQKAEAELQLKFNAELEIGKAQKELDSYQLLIKTGIAPQLEPVIPDQSIDPLPDLADDAQMLKDMSYAVEDWGQKLRNSLEPMEEFQKRVEELNKEIANIVASGLSELFGNLFDSLAEDGVLTFEEISKAINQFVFDLIKATARLLIFKAIFAAFGINEGVGSILGSIVRPRKFATGGIITGPTLGMVGEAGTEAVLPLSYLNNLLGGTGQSTPTLALRGADLYWSWSQEHKKNNRYF